MKKLTQIVIATLITSSAYAETLTLHGRGQVLTDSANVESTTPNTIRKNVRVTLYNPNNFKVIVRLSTLQQAHGETVGDTELLSATTPETITIFSNTGYIYEPVVPVLPTNNLQGEKMCDLDMYQAIQTTNTNSNCITIPTVVRMSWQDSLIKNSDSSIKTVAPITGVLDYYYSRSVIDNQF